MAESKAGAWAETKGCMMVGTTAVLTVGTKVVGLVEWLVELLVVPRAATTVALKAERRAVEMVDQTAELTAEETVVRMELKTVVAMAEPTVAVMVGCLAGTKVVWWAETLVGLMTVPLALLSVGGMAVLWVELTAGLTVQNWVVKMVDERGQTTAALTAATMVGESAA
jgi:hypothetical protein